MDMPRDSFFDAGWFADKEGMSVEAATEILRDIRMTLDEMAENCPWINYRSGCLDDPMNPLVDAACALRLSCETLPRIRFTLVPSAFRAIQ